MLIRKFLIMVTFLQTLASFSFIPNENKLIGKWIYNIYFSTLDGGGAVYEKFNFKSDNTFSYSLKSYNYSKKLGKKDYFEAHVGNYKIENNYITFYNTRKQANTQKELIKKWQIVSFVGDKLKLKPEASREDGGYERTFSREN